MWQLFGAVSHIFLDPRHLLVEESQLAELSETSVLRCFGRSNGYFHLRGAQLSARGKVHVEVDLTSTFITIILFQSSYAIVAIALEAFLLIGMSAPISEALIILEGLTQGRPGQHFQPTIIAVVTGSKNRTRNQLELYIDFY